MIENEFDRDGDEANKESSRQLISRQEEPSQATIFRRYKNFINRKYVSRRTKQFEENESDFSDESSDDADLFKPNHKFRKYSAIFNNLMN